MHHVFGRFVGRFAFLGAVLAAGIGCVEAPATPPEPSASSTSPTRPGAKVLADRGFDLLAGQRVGLIVNHTAVIDTVHLIDRVAAHPDVTLTALFGPEHGLRGTADAGEKVDDGLDDRTGVPVYSLYGATRKPAPESLEGLDVLVFDIQDIGARFYTYISTMGLSMQAAAEAGLPFVVLDRPNPLGGTQVDGFVLEPAHTSFVGQYPIPIQHGMTVGELAQMIQGEGWLPGLDSLDLRVVPVAGWQRAQRWPDTGLSWIPPSPNIPDFETALVYPGTCFFEATAASEGRGTYAPFVQVGAPWAEAEALARTLNAQDLPGVTFEAASFTPASIGGMASSPKLQGEAVQGVRLRVTDAATFRPVVAGLHVLDTFAREAGEGAFLTRPDWLTRLAGTERLGLMMDEGRSVEAIVAAWADETERFLADRQPYLLYD
ncbi:MAG: DUF1343 domain-containing protein [Bacteroidota bacterium]